jgi:hypothetical protein
VVSANTGHDCHHQPTDLVSKIFPTGVHVLAFLLFSLGVFSAINSWEKLNDWQDLIVLPAALAGSVYVAGLFVVLRIQERRDRLIKLLFGRKS